MTEMVFIAKFITRLRVNVIAYMQRTEYKSYFCHWCIGADTIIIIIVIIMAQERLRMHFYIHFEQYTRIAHTHTQSAQSTQSTQSTFADSFYVIKVGRSFLLKSQSMLDERRVSYTIAFACLCSSVCVHHTAFNFRSVLPESRNFSFALHEWCAQNCWFFFNSERIKQKSRLISLLLSLWNDSRCIWIYSMEDASRILKCANNQKNKIIINLLSILGEERKKKLEIFQMERIMCNRSACYFRGNHWTRRER